MTSSRLEDYVGLGTSADRPTSLDLPAACAGFRYETDSGGAWVWDGTAWVQLVGAGVFGDVSGPASSVNNRIATFSGTTGKLIQDGGVLIASVLVSGGPLGTPSSGVATNLTSIPVANSVGILPSANGGAGTVNGVMKANGAGVVSAAVAATDYAAAPTGTANTPLFNNGAGGFTNGTLSGNTTKLVTTTGTLPIGNLLAIDTSGNAVDSGVPTLALIALPAGTAIYDQLTWDGAAWQPQRPRWGAGCYVPGLLTSNQNLLLHRFDAATTIPANFTGYLGHVSQAGGAVAATASTVVTVAKALAASPTSFSSVGTITISAGTVAPIFASSGGSAITFAQGDVLRLRGPAVPDATFSDFFCTLAGFCS